MSIDGLSMNQVKPARELPSNHLSFEADEIAALQTNNKVTEVEGSAKQKGITRKEENYGEDVANQHAGGDTSTTEEEKKDEADEILEIIEADEKRYCLKFNPKSAMVQLYDNKKKKVVRSIDEEYLMKVIAKFSYPAGIICTEEV